MSSSFHRNILPRPCYILAVIYVPVEQDIKLRIDVQVQRSVVALYHISSIDIDDSRKVFDNYPTGLCNRKQNRSAAIRENRAMCGSIMSNLQK